MADIRIDADAKAALAEYEKIVRKQKDIGDSQDQIVNKSRSAAGEERRLANLRNKLLRETDTAQEKYKKRLDEATTALKGVENSERRLGQVRQRLFDEYQEELEKQNRELEDIDDSLEDINREGAGAFDSERVFSFSNALSGVGAVATAALQTIRGMREEAEAAGQALRGTAASTGSLAQLAGGDRRLLDRLVSEADGVFSSGLVETREQANKLIFELQSAGKLDEVQFFSRLNAIDDASLLAKSAGLIGAGFQGGDDVGTSSQVISKAIAAATPATGVSVSDIAEGVASASAAAKPFGLSDEEVFAAVSLISQTTGSGSQAGTQLRSLLSALTRKGLADELNGQGLPAILAAVREQSGSAAERISFLGGDEAARGFAPLEDASKFGERLQEIINAQSSGLANATINNALRLDSVRATRAARQGEAFDALSKDRAAVRDLLASAEADAFTSFARETFGETAGFVVGQGFAAGRFIPGVDDRLANNRRGFLEGQDVADGVAPSIDAKLGELVEATREQTGAANKTREAVENLQGVPTR